MKADLSRLTDRPEASYRAVRLQQGRVQTDADFNEQQDIVQRRVETEAVDVVGAAGAPLATAGFALTAADGQINVGPGRYYLDGLLVRNPAACTVVTQPWLPRPVSPVVPTTPLFPAPQPLLGLQPAAAPALADIRVYNAAGAAVLPTDGLYVGYLEAWVRHVTALEDPLLREVALGGPDTATREQLAWQVKLLRAGALGDPISCISAEPFNSYTAPSAGKLAARALPGVATNDPCELSPEAGYRRLENQLYRVEVHDDGSVLGKARFKWQRDNGSIVSEVTRWVGEPGPGEFEVASLGRDDVLAITVGCWVEFFDDRTDLLGRPGTLAQVLKTDGRIVTIDTTPAKIIGPALDQAAYAAHPRVRRWDGFADLVPAAEAAAGGWVLLEGGVEVKFTPGKLRVGDWWVIPARTATADVEWPKDPATGKPVFVQPQGVRRAFARLAVLSCTGGVWALVADCRPLFPPLTELTQLQYVGGDGQQAMPNPLAPANVALPSPLEAAVLNGQHPVAGAVVRFVVSHGALPNGTLTQDVTTPVSGIAAIVWSVSPSAQRQTATAQLLVAGAPAPERYAPLHYTATLSTAARVSYDPAKLPALQALGINNVQDAIDALGARGSGDACCATVGVDGTYPTLEEAIRALIARKVGAACLCLLPGRHVLNAPLSVPASSLRCLSLHGAGRATVLDLGKHALAIEALDELLLRDFDIVTVETADASVKVTGCAQISLHGVHVGAFARSTPMVTLSASRRIDIDGCRFTAVDVLRVGQMLGELFDRAPRLAPFAGALGLESIFIAVGADVANAFVQMPAAERATLAKEIEAVTSANGGMVSLSPESKQMLRLLQLELGTPRTTRLRGALERARRALLSNFFSPALCVGTMQADISIVDSVVDGGLCLGDAHAANQADPLLSPSDASRVRAALREPMWLRPGASTVRLHGCELRTVLRSEECVKSLGDLLQQRGQAVTDFPSVLMVDHCTIIGYRWEVVATVLMVSHNVFATFGNVIGNFVALQAKYVGNGGGEKLTLYAVTVTPDLLANAPLNLVTP